MIESETKSFVLVNKKTCPADLRKVQLFEHFTCISFGKEGSRSVQATWAKTGLIGTAGCTFFLALL